MLNWEFFFQKTVRLKFAQWQIMGGGVKYFNLRIHFQFTRAEPIC